MKEIKRFFMSLLIAFAGFFGVMFFIIALNEKSLDKDKKPEQKQTVFKVEKIKKPPVKPKKKKKKERVKKAAKAKAPKPIIPSTLMGASFDIPSLEIKDIVSDNLLGEVESAKDLLMTAGSVDTKPRPSITNKPPAYPKQAARDGITGKITLKILLSKEGRVLKSRVTKSLPKSVFDDAAIKAVANWTFEPAMYKGQPVKIWIDQEVIFEI